MPRKSKKVRYAVVGLGHIAQVAVLPAFAHANNSELAALVSEDPLKLSELGDKYEVEQRYSYEQYDECLASGDVDAVYIALPNHLHCEYAVRAAHCGVHVLCEKPMAVTVEECRRMIDAATAREVKLMIAYRLHFEPANLEAIKLVQSGQLGNPRVFSSFFCMRVAEDNIRTDGAKGGGTLFDIGIYCINAARYLFREEPTEVMALSAANREDPRFQEVDESTGAVLRFPGERLATFTASFGATDVSRYHVAGTEGELRVEPAYTYTAPIKHDLTIGGKTTRRSFRKRDQFAPELAYFSNCILTDTSPEPGGAEGMLDVRLIQALYRSATTQRAVRIDDFDGSPYPTTEQKMYRPPVSEPEPVHASSPKQ